MRNRATQRQKRALNMLPSAHWSEKIGDRSVICKRLDYALCGRPQSQCTGRANNPVQWSSRFQFFFRVLLTCFSSMVKLCTDSCKALTSINIHFLTPPGALHSLVHCNKPTKSAPIFFKTISGRKCLFVQLVPIWHWYLVLVKPRFFHLQKSQCVLVIDQWSSFMSRVS